MDVLTNQKYLTFEKISRYSSVPVYYNKLRKNYMCGTSQYISRDTDYQLYKVQFGDTFDSIALKFYNNPSQFWAICNFNGVDDSFKTPRVGSYIKIPTISDITFKEVR